MSWKHRVLLNQVVLRYIRGKWEVRCCASALLFCLVNGGAGHYSCCAGHCARAGVDVCREFDFARTCIRCRAAAVSRCMRQLCDRYSSFGSAVVSEVLLYGDVVLCYMSGNGSVLSCCYGSGASSGAGA
jgi:hypothetical protein